MIRKLGDELTKVYVNCMVKKVKCTVVQALRLCTGRTVHRGSRGIALLFHDHSPRRGWGVGVTPQPLFTPQERPGTHWTGGWVGPKAGLDRCGKSRLPPGFNPQTIRPVTSHYTDYATRPTFLFMAMRKRKPVRAVFIYVCVCVSVWLIKQRRYLNGYCFNFIFIFCFVLIGSVILLHNDYIFLYYF